MNKYIVFSFLATLFYYNLLSNAQKSNQSFYIDYHSNTFVKDGKQFRYVSGSIHSYRVPRDLWEDRLNKMWTAGLNAIQIYLFWNEHEPSPGVYDFEGQNDIFEFMRIAQKIGFVVIFRAGPYVCGEHDFGGLPWWILKNKSILPRTNEKNYMNAVNRWYQYFLPKLIPFLYKNGGPVITVQVENEYGFFYAADKAYQTSLRDLFYSYLGNDVILFTTDPPTVIETGSIEGVYPTVDFGIELDVNSSFQVQRIFAPSGPLVNSEFYPGWLDFWGTPHQKRDTALIVKKLTEILDLNANVNFYMFHGGTNFGFSNGADPPFNVEPTSYDYDAPISEAGDITPKYLEIRKAISKYLPIPSKPIPSNSTKKAYGKIKMKRVISVVDATFELNNETNCINSLYPQSFEILGQGYGFILYSIQLDDPNVDGKVLSIPGIRDRAFIQIGSKSVGVLYRTGITQLKINLPDNKNTSLYILVENMGRYNFGNNLIDLKGIISNVTLDEKILFNWRACLTSNFIPNFQMKKEEFFKKTILNTLEFSNSVSDVDYKVPAFYIGQFDAVDTNVDSFLKMDKFTKGIAIIGSENTLTNLGRYWPKTGPQVTLYSPGVFNTPNTKNEIILIELEGSSCYSNDDCYVELIDYPIIDSLS